MFLIQKREAIEASWEHSTRVFQALKPLVGHEVNLKCYKAKPKK
jgi:hypothetical protein